MTTPSQVPNPISQSDAVGHHHKRDASAGLSSVPHGGVSGMDVDNDQDLGTAVQVEGRMEEGARGEEEDEVVCVDIAPPKRRKTAVVGSARVIHMVAGGVKEEEQMEDVTAAVVEPLNFEEEVTEAYNLLRTACMSNAFVACTMLIIMMLWRCMKMTVVSWMRRWISF